MTARIVSNILVQFADALRVKKAVFVSLVIGLILGTVCFFSPGLLFVIFLSALCIFLVLKYLPPEERRFVKWALIIGLSLRIILSAGLDIWTLAFVKGAVIQRVEEKNPPDTNYERLLKEWTRTCIGMPDSDYYSMRGYVYTVFARGMNNQLTRHYLLSEALSYGWSAYLLIIGLFYYLFDYSPIAVKFLNCIISMLAAVFTYKIALNFNHKAARIALLGALFFPSLILWSITNLKEPILTLLSVLCVWGFMVFLRGKKIRYLAVTLLAMFALVFFTRQPLWLILFAALSFAFLMTRPLRQKLVLICVSLAAYALLPQLRDNLSVRKIIRNLYVVHIGHVNTGGITYSVLKDQYYTQPDLLYTIAPVELFVSVAGSILHFLFEPLPNHLKSMSLIFGYLQMPLWYLVVFLAVLGAVRITFYEFKTYFPLLSYTVICSLMLALTSGNVGTLFRHRDLLTPFYLIFAAVGITSIFKLEKKDFRTGNEPLS